MKLNLSTVVGFFIVFAFGAQASASDCVPAKLVHITIVDIMPGIDPASFSAQPRTYYRIGSGKARIEEADDAVNGIHGVIVSAEPDIWMANLHDGTGKHIVDPGPTFFAKLPLFGEALSGKLMDLELGCEADVVAQYAPKPVRVDQVGGVGYDVHRIEDGPDAVEILERPGTSIPVLARLFRQGKLEDALRYDLYLTNLPDDPDLFLPPANVHYVEAK